MTVNPFVGGSKCLSLWPRLQVLLDFIGPLGYMVLTIVLTLVLHIGLNVMDKRRQIWRRMGSSYICPYEVLAIPPAPNAGTPAIDYGVLHPRLQR